MFTVIDELAHRVADRSPPSKLTSTPSAFVMLRTLSVSALISSREYIMVSSVYQRGPYEEFRSLACNASRPQRSAPRRRVHLRGARNPEAVRCARPSVSRAGAGGDDDQRRGSDRDDWRCVDVGGPVHAAGRVRAIWP